mmetsp:Transcript_23056/g.54390  ORF Transcript_23056/g.54390 Transcript_23056/m.54390 type:complete len:213 (+) Transcript_23056:495-1133(+)
MIGDKYNGVVQHPQRLQDSLDIFRGHVNRRCGIASRVLRDASQKSPARVALERPAMYHRVLDVALHVAEHCVQDTAHVLYWPVSYILSNPPIVGAEQDANVMSLELDISFYPSKVLVLKDLSGIHRNHFAIALQLIVVLDDPNTEFVLKERGPGVHIVVLHRHPHRRDKVHRPGASHHTHDYAVVMAVLQGVQEFDQVVSSAAEGLHPLKQK